MLSRSTMLVCFWLGAAVLFVAVVAPSAFAVLPTRAMAGLVVGRVLPVLFWSGAIVGALILFLSHGWRRAAATVLVLASLGAQLGVAPQIQRARVSLGPDLEAIAAADPRRVAFGRLHGISVALLGVGMLGAAAIAIGGLVTRRAPRTPDMADSHESVNRTVPPLPAGV